MRVYIPATLGMLRALVDSGKLEAVSGTAFALTKNRLAPSFATAVRLADLVTRSL